MTASVYKDKNKDEWRGILRLKADIVEVRLPGDISKDEAVALLAEQQKLADSSDYPDHPWRTSSLTSHFQAKREASGEIIITTAFIQDHSHDLPTTPRPRGNVRLLHTVVQSIDTPVKMGKMIFVWEKLP
jgi:hypothetical protein